MRLVDAVPIEHYYEEILATANKNERSLIKYTDRALARIKGAPSVPARVMKAGMWIIDEKGLYECSVCHSKFSVNECMTEPRWNGCPMCFSEIQGTTRKNSIEPVLFGTLATA